LIADSNCVRIRRRQADLKVRLYVAAHMCIADPRPAWSCAEQNLFSEYRNAELLGASMGLRSRMVMAAASITDAQR